MGFGAERSVLGELHSIGAEQGCDQAARCRDPDPNERSRTSFQFIKPTARVNPPAAVGGRGGGAGCAGSGCGAGAGWERAGRAEPIAGAIAGPIASPIAGPIAGPIAVLLAERPGERALPTPRRHRACCRPRLAAGRGAPFCCMAFFYLLFFFLSFCFSSRRFLLLPSRFIFLFHFISLPLCKSGKARSGTVVGRGQLPAHPRASHNPRLCYSFIISFYPVCRFYLLFH